MPSQNRKLVVDTDVASYVFKWHPVFAPGYVGLLQGADLILSFMTVAEIRQCALQANWGGRQRSLMETYLADFAVSHSDNALCLRWAEVRNETDAKGGRWEPPMHGLRLLPLLCPHLS